MLLGESLRVIRIELDTATPRASCVPQTITIHAVNVVNQSVPTAAVGHSSPPPLRTRFNVSRKWSTVNDSLWLIDRSVNNEML